MKSRFADGSSRCVHLHIRATAYTTQVVENSASSDAIFGDKNVVMAYNSTGLVHVPMPIMETPTWLRDNADPALRRIGALTYPGETNFNSQRSSLMKTKTW